MSYSIPQGVRSGIDDYVANHREQGGFVTSVLRNDLKWAVMRADPASFAALKVILLYCSNEIPPRCWGSPERVDAWLQSEVPA